ncbi:MULTISPECIES: hypothetical protein [Streptococcus]|uniref:Type II toxin-antitoxin system RelB/DinJ family antitoxin n=1 Tax=Streptococcus caledonicus TaxID=2614158 RepID=A0ABW0UAH5_9STRE|nr:hypothetical protein [Streptococcus sp. S784/96/1]
MSDKNITFEMDSDTLAIASSILAENDYSVTGAIRVFLQQVALTGKVNLPTEEEIEKVAIFYQL